MTAALLNELGSSRVAALKKNAKEMGTTPEAYLKKLIDDGLDRNPNWVREGGKVARHPPNQRFPTRLNFCRRGFPTHPNC